MEIKEIVSYFLNEQTDVLDVTFRTIEDGEDVVRIDRIDFLLAEEYGFELINETFDFFDDDLDDDSDDEYSDGDKIEIDEDELILFLNEYYMMNEDELPKPEFL